MIVMFIHGSKIVSISPTLGRLVGLSTLTVLPLLSRTSYSTLGVATSRGVIDGVAFTYEAMTAFNLTDHIKYSMTVPGGIYNTTWFLVMKIRPTFR